jgi:hypothetical protein
MKRKLRGLKQRDIQLDFNLYRVSVPIRALPDMKLSVVDIWPEGDGDRVVEGRNGYVVAFGQRLLE